MSQEDKYYFSVVIPALNEENYLPYLLKDLNRQTYKNFEVIIVDGNSEDGTIKKALSFKKDLKSLTVINAKKRNVSYQRNLGAKMSQGKYILFLDADDRLPRYFIDGVKYRLSLAKADIFTTWCDVESKKPGDKAIGSLLNWGIEVGNLVEHPTGNGTMIGITKKGFEKIEGFDDKKHYGEDEDFIRRACRQGLSFKIYHDPRYFYSLRRFKKEGKMGVLRNFAKLQLKKSFDLPIEKKEYQMGGKYHISDRRLKGWFLNYQKNLEHATKRKYYMKKLKDLLRVLDEEFYLKK